MHFSHADEIWQDFPELVAGVLAVEGINPEASVGERTAVLEAEAHRQLDGRTEADLPQIQAWRRAFSKMGLKPTQYRCAAESLLRRFRKEGSLPRIHPLVDLCNALSLAHALPIAVFDCARITVPLQVRRARGDERYQSFSGEVEHPEPGEVVFSDESGRAHARRWTNRQSGDSAVGKESKNVLIVAEGLHEQALVDVPRLLEAVAREIALVWSTPCRYTVLSRSSPTFPL